MGMLTNAQIEQSLQEYYKAHYGECDTDVWYDQPAVNVWVFRRDGKIITLQCHILTGIVTEQTAAFPVGEAL